MPGNARYTTILSMHNIIKTNCSQKLGLFVQLFFVCIVCLPVVSPCFAIQSKNGVEQIEGHIKHAETSYWVGMAEQGNMEVFEKGLDHLRKAELLLDTDELTETQTAGWFARIHALRTDIEEQARIAHDTMYGVFPLSRLLVPTLFSDPRTTELYEVLDEPRVVAAVYGAKDLALKVIHEWKDRAQLDVIFNSVPLSRQLENEALYVFNRSSKFFVHNYDEAVRALPPELMDEFNLGEVTPKTIQHFFDAFGINNLMVVTVREVDIAHHDFFYLVEGRIYNNKTTEPTHSFFNYGFCIDRRKQLMPILLANVLLFLLAIISYTVIGYFKRKTWPKINEMIHPVCGFLFARFFAWLLIQLMGAIKPRPEMLAQQSWWWPVATISAVILGPLLVYWLLAARLASLSSSWNFTRREAGVFIAATLGSCAYLAGPLFLLMGNTAIWTFIPVVLAFWIISFMLGQTIDRLNPLPEHMIAVPLLLIPFVSAALCHTSPILVWACAGLSAIIVLLMTLYHRGDFKTTSRQAAQLVPATDLMALAKNPPYKQLPFFDEIWDSFKNVMNGQTVWIALSGSAGVGKTATANELIKKLTEAEDESGQEPVILQGMCSKPEAENVEKAYEPFQVALAKHYQINLLGERDSQIQKLSTAVGKAFTSAIPFSDILLPPADENAKLASSRDEIIASIVHTIRDLATNKIVVLFIDDIHWMDQASKQILVKLLKDVPPGQNLSLAVLLTGRDTGTFTQIGFNNETDCRITVIEEPTREQRCRIIKSSLNLEEDTAEKIVSQVGDFTKGQGALFWLFYVIAHLAKSGALCQREDGKFILAREFAGGKTLPMPVELYTSLREEFLKFPQYRMVLECAACLGQFFNVSILSKGLEMSRLQLLDLLRQIEQETHIITDVGKQDDIYSFHSSFMLEVIRKELAISVEGPRSDKVPQMVREYHARVAAAMEKTLNESKNLIFDVATHYYAAGTMWAKQAAEACIRAANISRDVFEFERALMLIEMAEECVEVADLDMDLSEQRLLIECDMAHVRGQSNIETTQQAVKELADNPDYSLDTYIAVARLCYEARRHNQKMCQECIRIGTEVRERADSQLHKAQAYQFIGLGYLGLIGLKPKEECVKEAENNLREALKCAEQNTDNDIQARRLLGRVANSLAEFLSYGSEDNKIEAEQLFNKSLAIREDPKIGDLPGLARTHGGCGRLALAKKPPDLDKAYDHFKADLDICLQIGDAGGEAMMYSLLGRCDKLKGLNFDRAIDYYYKSWDKSSSLPNKLYAGAGLLECLSRADRIDELHIKGQDILELIQENSQIPGDCAEELLEAMKICQEQAGSDKWCEQLKQQITKVSNKPKK